MIPQIQVKLSTDPQMGTDIHNVLLKNEPWVFEDQGHFNEDDDKDWQEVKKFLTNFFKKDDSVEKKGKSIPGGRYGCA